METVIINLFGPPGSGKSTTAANLFGVMKLLGKSVELVHEVAKDYTWEHRNVALNCQPLIFGKQLFRLEKLLGQVEYVVTDSPILLSAIYGNEGYEWVRYVCHKFKSMKNINYYINRVKDYNPVGRNQTEGESDEIGQAIRLVLAEHAYFKTVNGDDSAVPFILDDLKIRLLKG